MSGSSQHAAPDSVVLAKKKLRQGATEKTNDDKCSTVIKEKLRMRGVVLVRGSSSKAGKPFSGGSMKRLHGDTNMFSSEVRGCYKSLVCPQS